MDSKLTSVTSALQSIKKYGWCNIGKSRKSEIEIVKFVLLQCGSDYSVRECEHSIKIFAKDYS